MSGDLAYAFSKNCRPFDPSLTASILYERTLLREEFIKSGWIQLDYNVGG